MDFPIRYCSQSGNSNNANVNLTLVVLYGALHCIPWMAVPTHGPLQIEPILGGAMVP